MNAVSQQVFRLSTHIEIMISKKTVLGWTRKSCLLALKTKDLRIQVDELFHSRWLGGLEKIFCYCFTSGSWGSGLI